MATNGQRTFTATIDRVNDRGFVTKEQPAVWLNISRYAEPAPLIPEPGTVVTVTLDGSGFVRAIEPTDQLPLSAASAAPVRPTAGRDRTITRLSILKSAARFLADKPERTSGDVLVVAESWEKWIDRD